MWSFSSSLFFSLPPPLSAQPLTLPKRSKGLVSEAGLERLAKKLELEFMWESPMGSSDRKTLIVAGSALELLVEFSNNVVQSVSLGFPDSAEIVNKHAQAAGEILFRDLQLRKGQSPLTKTLDRFAANFERLAILDKLSINPGLNLYEAVAGVYESLARLHAWELRKAREDPSLAGRSGEYLESLVLCTKSGSPVMNARNRVGLSLDYWKERRLLPVPGPDVAAWAAEHEQTWSILIGCAPLRDIGVSPVRISDRWIGPEVEKAPLPDELHAGGPVIDWLEPEATFIPTPDQAKPDPMQSEAPLLGPRLPEAVFHATFDPPVHIPVHLWHQIQELGCLVEDQFKQLKFFDSLVLPSPAGNDPDTAETRTISCTKTVPFVAPGASDLSQRRHAYTLHVYKPVLCKTLTEMTFSHPRQLVAILPYLRQYVFLAMLLQNSFDQPRAASVPTTDNGKSATKQGVVAAAAAQNGSSTSSSKHNNNKNNSNNSDNPDKMEEDVIDNDAAQQPPANIDVVLTLLPVPRVQVVFPFGDRTADVTLEVRENGRVQVEAQNVFEEEEEEEKEEKGEEKDGENAGGGSSGAGGGGGRRWKRRRVEDLGALLEMTEDIGKWVEFIRTRWA